MYDKKQINEKEKVLYVNCGSYGEYNKIVV